MGWWWSSTINDSTASSVATPTWTDTPAPNKETSTKPSGDDTKPTSTRPLTRDEEADQEFQKLLSDLQNEPQPSSRPIQGPFRFFFGSDSNSTPSTSQAPEIQQPSDRHVDDSGDIASANIPTTLRCRDCFDYAFFCQSFGGQFVNVYRYGGLKDCRDHWSDFWFCMRTKSYGEEERKGMIQDRWRKKELKIKTGPSSEDVWRQRDKRVTGAFMGDWEEIFKAEKELEDSIESGFTSATTQSEKLDSPPGVEKLDTLVNAK